jgi:hypothetical protein
LALFVGSLYFKECLQICTASIQVPFVTKLGQGVQADPGDTFVMLPRVKAIVISIPPVGRTVRNMATMHDV